MASNTDPVTVLIFSARKPGMAFEQYRDHYENNHCPFVGRLVFEGDHAPTVWARHYMERDGKGAASSFPLGGSDAWEYDCITLITFKGAQHRDTAFGLFHKHQQEIEEDEARFLDRSKTKIIFATDPPSTK